MAELERSKSQKLRELDELKSNFFTNVRHEFRTPLTLLLGPLRQMQEGTFTGDLPSYVRMMTRNGERLEHLIDQRRRLRERFGRERGIQLKEIAVTSADQQFLDRLVAHIETQMSDETLSVVELSEHMHLSRSQLHRKLKALTDKSPSVFLRTIRLHRAKDLLQKGAGNVSDICFQVGFSVSPIFRRLSKKSLVNLLVELN